MRRSIYESGAFAVVGMTLAGIGGNLLGAGYPGWGKVFILIGCVLIAIAVCALLWDGASWLLQRRTPPLQLGLLDYAPVMTASMAAIGKSQVQISDALNSATASMNARGAALQTETDMTKRQELAGEMAKDIESACDVISAMLPVLKSEVSKMRAAALGLIRASNEDVAEMQSFGAALRNLRETAKGTEKSFKELRARAQWFRRLNLSGALNIAATRMASTIGMYLWRLAEMNRALRRIESSVARKVRRKESAAKRRVHAK